MSFQLSNRDGGSSTTSDADKAPLLPIHERPSSLEAAASSSSSSSNGSPSTSTTTKNDTKHQAMQLLFGAGGIYASFLYYGSLQEDVFRYESEDGIKFTHAWYLQVLESLANVLFGTIALVVMGANSRTKNSLGLWWGGTRNLPKKPFVSSGFTQVCSKGFTSLALANGLSFPVATLAKSGKMAPVMIGSLLLGGATYGIRDYLQVLAIIGGTAILSMNKKASSTPESTPLGLVFILLALVMDGLTGGVQKRLLADMKRVQITPQPYDLMTFTNLFMMMFALVISAATGEFTQGIQYCSSNPKVFSLIWKFSLCSAIGQSFIFYTLARFDPLVCSTVTTTRKILSVLYSILFKGHSVAGQGWLGLGLAVGGIGSEVMHAVLRGGKKKTKSKTSM